MDNGYQHIIWLCIKGFFNLYLRTVLQKAYSIQFLGSAVALASRSWYFRPFVRPFVRWFVGSFVVR